MLSAARLQTVTRLAIYAAAIFIVLGAASAALPTSEAPAAVGVTAEPGIRPALPRTTGGWLALGLMILGLASELAATRRAWR